ncbi:MAG: ergothioneine biosynthesis protein EgtB [Hyphomicrobiaceae bacterium]
MIAGAVRRHIEPGDVLAQFLQAREDSRHLAAPLSDADATAQSMPEASPAKWHLAHTTWFFERLVLAEHVRGYEEFDPAFNFLFNSYYETIGDRQPRPRRGMITRPALDRVLDYRDHVDEAMARLLRDTFDPLVAELIELGCHHEQQHQELLLTDILHLFAQNPLKPAYKLSEPLAVDSDGSQDFGWHSFAGGIVEIGHDGSSFAFDCETPRHRVVIEPYQLAERQVTNGEWIDFIEDGGYRETLLWLSAGWDWVRTGDRGMPLYWERRDGEYWTMTLRGAQPVDRAAPVTHLSYFEADAYATWAGCRLPSEAEWETAASGVPVEGNLANCGRLRPRPAQKNGNNPAQFYGDTWEWTCSAYAAYPGYRPVEGTVGEYNGKFMCGQFILRGGSCVTPAGHIRATYRNFFPPDAQWQFSGLRLAKDLSS